MNSRLISSYSRMKKGMLDDKYDLYENGDVINTYDANIYPGNQDLRRVLNAKNLQQDIKEKLLDNTKESNKQLAKALLEL